MPLDPGSTQAPANGLRGRALYLLDGMVEQGDRIAEKGLRLEHKTDRSGALHPPEPGLQP